LWSLSKGNYFHSGWVPYLQFARLNLHLGRAIDFWNYQFQTSLEYEKAELKQSQINVVQIEKIYNEKLEDAHNKISTLRKQLEAMRKEAENDKKEIIDLQEKYSDKARQKRKLEELYETLKQKVESGCPSRPHTSYLTLSFPDGKSRLDTSCDPPPQRSSSPRSPLLRQTPDISDIDRFTYAKHRDTSRLTSPVSKQLQFAATPKPAFRVLKMPESPRFLKHNNR